jgi:hypothetical protein
MGANLINHDMSERLTVAHSECYANVWAIRLYKVGDAWEACFFHCDGWHEHVKGESSEATLALARSTIDERIKEGR